jgi:DNA modification methylase
MTAVVLRGDARHLPLPDACVDLLVTSPPYFGLRSYVDGGVHFESQIGSEATPAEWLAALVECTAEWVRVLKPSGSIFVNLGDKYAGSGPGSATTNAPNFARHFKGGRTANDGYRAADTSGTPVKSLLGLPWRYALACMDQLGLILRRDIIWSKPNGLPESVTDRCRSSHEYLFHLVRQPRYYAAVDEIREPQDTLGERHGSSKGRRALALGFTDQERTLHPLGKLPGSVWSIPSQPLTVPAGLGVDHFAAFPMELPRRCVLGWSPPGVCTACGEGRRPVTDKTLHPDGPARTRTVSGRHSPGDPRTDALLAGGGPIHGLKAVIGSTSATITGYACACTPYTGHPGTGHGKPYHQELAEGRYALSTDGGPRDTTHPGHAGLWDRPKTGPWREYHLDGWTPPPTRPALVVDPFGGTGTTALVASMYGRTGLSFDLSADYCRLARWRTRDPAERAKALQVPKPPPVPDGQASLFDDEAV